MDEAQMLATLREAVWSAQRANILLEAVVDALPDKLTPAAFGEIVGEFDAKRPLRLVDGGHGRATSESPRPRAACRPRLVSPVAGDA